MILIQLKEKLQMKIIKRVVLSIEVIILAWIFISIFNVGFNNIGESVANQFAWNFFHVVGLM